jgi:hypothetical protein
MSYIDLFPILMLAVAIAGAAYFDITGRRLDKDLEAERRRHTPAE